MLERKAGKRAGKKDRKKCWKKGKKTDPSDGADGQIMSVSDGLAVDPERAGLPAIRQ